MFDYLSTWRIASGFTSGAPLPSFEQVLVLPPYNPPLGAAIIAFGVVIPPPLGLSMEFAVEPHAGGQLEFPGRGRP
jgi:hypothetical protein